MTMRGTLPPVAQWKSFNYVNKMAQQQRHTVVDHIPGFHPCYGTDLVSDAVRRAQARWLTGGWVEASAVILGKEAGLGGRDGSALPLIPPREL
jgi:hypothetical protein